MATTTPPTITELPETFSRLDPPADFAVKADNWVAAQPTYRNELNALGSNVYANAVDAETSATEAASSASSATTSASNASTSETNATASASAASTSETNASNSASAASTSETNAATSASNAATSEANALTYKNEAEIARDTAVAVAAGDIIDDAQTTTGLVWSSTKIATELGTKGDISGVDFTGHISEAHETITSTTNSVVIDCSGGNAYTHTLTENTTLAFSNIPTTGQAYFLTFKLIQDASASGYTFTWPASIKWPSATAPTLTATASGEDVFILYTVDGGTTWNGFTAGQALATV